MRARALQLGLAEEATRAPITPADLEHGDGALLLNSLGCRPISHLHGTALASGVTSTAAATEAERFWRRLLEP
jgi:hypothetical protein